LLANVKCELVIGRLDMILATNEKKRVSGHRAVTEQEKSLIAGCVKGDKATWDAFVRQYSGLIYHTIKKTLSLHHTEPRSDIVDDLFQGIRDLTRWHELIRTQP
jgi:hypothetical protein